MTKNKGKEILYSYSDLLGEESTEFSDRVYSEEQVEEFSDLFAEFYEIHGDNYAEIDDAYSEFLEAYTSIEGDDLGDNSELEDEYSYVSRKDLGVIELPEIKNNPNVISPMKTRALAAASGAGVGFVASKALNSRDRKLKNRILKKMTEGRATSTEIEKLNKIKKKMSRRTLASTALGAAGGAGALEIYKKLNMKDTNNSTEDQFSEDFSNFYIENLNTYGDSDEGIDEAYNDYVASLEEGEGDNYSEELDEHAVQFADFYSEMEEVYGENIEEAYNDFMELNESLGDDTYSELEDEDEFSEEELAFIEFYSENEETYGDNLDEAYADFMGEDEEDAQFSAEDYYGDAESFVEDFADFYSELEDVYGDDVETAFDDYADALESITSEDEEDVYADTRMAKARAFGTRMGGKAKGAMNSRGGKIAGTAAAGAGIGALTAMATDKNAKERKALKAKAKAGALNANETARLAELKKARRNRLMKGAGVGAAVGAAGSAVATSDKAKDALHNLKVNKKVRSKQKAEDGKATTKRLDGVGNALKNSKWSEEDTNSNEDKNFSFVDKSDKKDLPGSFVTSLIK